MVPGNVSTLIRIVRGNAIFGRALRKRGAPCDWDCERPSAPDWGFLVDMAQISSVRVVVVQILAPYMPTEADWSDCNIGAVYHSARRRGVPTQLSFMVV